MPLPLVTPAIVSQAQNLSSQAKDILAGIQDFYDEHLATPAQRRARRIRIAAEYLGLALRGDRSALARLVEWVIGPRRAHDPAPFKAVLRTYFTQSNERPDATIAAAIDWQGPLSGGDANGNGLPGLGGIVPTSDNGAARAGITQGGGGAVPLLLGAVVLAVVISSQEK